MAGPLIHKYRIIAMEEFGKTIAKDKEFEFRELLDFMNSYKNKQGRPHRFVPLTKQQLGNLLQSHLDFAYLGRTIWKYKGELDEDKQ